MKILFTILLFLSPTLTFAKTLEVSCHNSDCFTYGGIITEPGTSYKYDYSCLDDDCKTKGWTGTDSLGTTYNIRCIESDCIHRGYISTESNAGKIYVENTKCIQNDCLAFGWEIESGNKSTGWATCKHNDCVKYGGIAFWRGMKSETTCHGGNCYKFGWTWAIEDKSEPIPTNFKDKQSNDSTLLTNQSTYVNGPLYIVSNNTIKTADFPNLEFVNGPIYIYYNKNLRTVNFPKLSYVNGPIYVTYNSHLESVSYPKITFVNGPIYFFGNMK